MKHPLLLLIALHLLFGCQSDPESAPTAEPLKTDIQKEISNNLSEDAIDKKVKTVRDYCIYNAEIFHKKMGIGLMTVLEGQMKPYNYTPKDSIILKDNAGRKLIMRRYDLPQPNFFWGIKINEEPLDKFIKPFHYSSEGQPDMLKFIWKSGTLADSNVVIQSFSDGATFKVQNAPFFMLSTWQETLTGSIVSINEGYVLRTKPDENSPKAEVTFKKFSYFTVLDFKDEWIQLAYLDPKAPSGRNKQQPCGWVKWYCSDAFQLEFSDNFFLESYFLGEEAYN